MTFDQAASIPVGIATAAFGLYSNVASKGAGLTPFWAKGGRGKYAGQPIVILGGSSNVGQQGASSNNGKAIELMVGCPASRSIGPLIWLFTNYRDLFSAQRVSPRVTRRIPCHRSLRTSRAFRPSRHFRPHPVRVRCGRHTSDAGRRVGSPRTQGDAHSRRVRGDRQGEARGGEEEREGHRLRLRQPI